MSSEPHWWSAPSEDSSERQALSDYAVNVADEHVRPLLALSAPVSVVSSMADTSFDTRGREYIDLRSGGGVFSLGHRSSVIVEKLVAALAYADIGDWQLPSRYRTDLARQLSATMTGGTWQWRYFVSGSEGNEFALRTALMATGRSRLVAIGGAYHGQTGLAAAVTDPRHLGRPYPRLAAEVVHIPAGDVGAIGERVDDRTAAVIAEPVQLTDGIRPLSPEYAREVRRRCDETGALLIFDEVKCGLNRTGPVWAYQRLGVLPDLMVVGKALSGGIYPLAACAMRRDGAQPTLASWHSDARSSYGGSHLAMIVGQAALAELTSPANRHEFEANGERLERELRDVLRPLGREDSVIRRGMAFAIGLDDEDLALFVASDLLHRRVLVPFPRSKELILLPPLTLSAANAKAAAERIAESIADGVAAL